MQQFCIQDIPNIKISSFILLPIRPTYLMEPNDNGIIPLSHLGCTNVSTKVANLSPDQVRVLIGLFSSPRKLSDECSMEQRAIIYLKNRFDNLEKDRDALMSRSKIIEQNSALCKMIIVLNLNLFSKKIRSRKSI